MGSPKMQEIHDKLQVTKVSWSARAPSAAGACFSWRVAVECRVLLVVGFLQVGYFSSEHPSDKSQGYHPLSTSWIVVEAGDPAFPPHREQVRADLAGAAAGAAAAGAAFLNPLPEGSLNSTLGAAFGLGAAGAFAGFGFGGGFGGAFFTLTTLPLTICE